MPCPTLPELRAAQSDVDKRLIAACEALTPESVGGTVRMIRKDRVQTDRADRVLLHLFQHQIHHRGQAHAMLAGTQVAPPQLDEFYMTGEAWKRADELARLGTSEQAVWRDLDAPR